MPGPGASYPGQDCGSQMPLIPGQTIPASRRQYWLELPGGGGLTSAGSWSRAPTCSLSVRLSSDCTSAIFHDEVKTARCLYPCLTALRPQSKDAIRLCAVGWRPLPAVPATSVQGTSSTRIKLLTPDQGPPVRRTPTLAKEPGVEG